VTDHGCLTIWPYHLMVSCLLIVTVFWRLILLVIPLFC